jgi:hypothetical protein
VKCDATNQVTELDLSGLADKGAARAAKSAAVDVAKLASMLFNFPQLQVSNHQRLQALHMLLSVASVKCICVLVEVVVALSGQRGLQLQHQ